METEKAEAARAIVCFAFAELYTLLNPLMDRRLILPSESDSTPRSSCCLPVHNTLHTSHITIIITAAATHRGGLQLTHSPRMVCGCYHYRLIAIFLRSHWIIIGPS